MFVWQVCEENALECREMGGRVGDTTLGKSTTACRGLRPHKDSRFTGLSVHYSSETCGHVDDRVPLSPSLVDRTFQVLLLEDAPWVQAIKETNHRHSELEGFYGQMIEFWFELLKHFPGSKTVSYGKDSISNISSGKFPALYDAAVHEVAIGNFDALVTDVYMTYERASMANFLPSIGTDHFYLVLPNNQEEKSYFELLQKPFEPFNAHLWLAMVGWGFVSALAFAICAGPDECTC